MLETTAHKNDGSSRTDPATVVELQARIERLLAAGRELIVQRDKACEERNAARSDAVAAKRQLEKLKTEGIASGGGDTARFRATKAAFARLYHPDRLQASGIERMVREEFFKEFWAEIERIEKAK